MTRSVLLNPVDHALLRVVTTRGRAWGDDAVSALVCPAEFRALQAHYPIVFQRSDEGGVASFQPVVLFGLAEGENLFASEQGWDSHCLPLSVQRQPFMIGRSGPDGESLMLHIDLDSPRLSLDQGEPLFDAHGGQSPYLEHMAQQLLMLHEGLQATPAFVQALLAHELLESFVLDVELNDGSQRRLAGYYTVDEERLAALPGPAEAALHAEGHLEAAYMVLASTGRFRDLIERQNRRLTQPLPFSF